MYQRIYPSNEIPPNYKGNAFEKHSVELEDHETQEDSIVKKEVSRLFERPCGKSFALDDLILAGLIVLLLNNHADDELLLILVLLFIVGL